MSILEKLGLSRKKSPGAPIIGEKKKQQEASATINHNVYVRVAIIVGFLALLILSVPQASFKGPINYNIGEPWKAEDLTAPYSFAINKSAEQIQQEKDAVRKTTPPIFHIDENADIIIESRIDSVFRNIQPVLTAYFDWKNAQAKRPKNASEDSLAFIQAYSTSSINLSDATWNALLENYWEVKNGGQLPETKTAPADEFIGTDLRNSMKNLVTEVLDGGIINTDKSRQTTNEITARNLKQSTEENKSIANIKDMQEAREYASYYFSRNYFEDIANAGTEIFNQVIKPNLIYNEKDTQAKIDEAIAQISSSKGAVAQSQVIIRRGDIVTKERANMLQSLADARAQNASDLERWLRFGGDVLAIFSIVTVFFFYLYLYRKSIFEDNAMLLLVLIAMSIICVASFIVFELDNISAYIVPVAITPIILTIIFDSRVGLLATITLALLTGLINGNDFEYVTATTVACSLGLFSVRDIKKRSQFFFTTPGIVFICYAVIVIGFNMTGFEGWNELFDDFKFLIINAIFILFTYPLILLFEKTFNVTTDFTLIELGDTNLPLLKELMTKAPGTFHHSLQVANLAEAAAGNIGANGLLCRVGALYHDIGKMENPGYFTENQTGTNEHDKLKPRMSALVIKAHVSNGVKLAKENGLPELLIEFIKTHHGTSTIKFFYDKAQKGADDDKDEIREEDFKYDGPLPQTKETGILLLADGVEAASRAMKDPNYQKLDNLITKMVDDRVYEGQLSRTPLTFQDLRAIKESFLNILVGIYHSRVEYPDDDKGKNQKKIQTPEPESGSKSNAQQKGESPKNEQEESSSTIDDYSNS